MKSKSRKKLAFISLACMLATLLIITSSKSQFLNKSPEETEEETTTANSTHAQSDYILPDDYEQRLETSLANNPELEDFVNNYTYKYGHYEESPIVPTSTPDGKVPLFIQWDSRWGYKEYGSNCMGLTGCGPTCLSMVLAYLKDDSQMTPVYLADYSTENGYYYYGSGTSWDLMSTGAEDLGLTVTELPLEENYIISSLEAGHPIICIMGPGVFTTEGHFIVLTDYNDGYYTINDPNSYNRSNELWTYEEFSDQILNLWAYEA